MSHTRLPTPEEITEWNRLRSLAFPGQSTIYTTYRVALPLLLDAHEHLTREVARLRAVVGAARLRVSKGHNDTCGLMLSDESPCSCGHDQLGEALEALP